MYTAMQKLPKAEIDNINKSCYEKIWFYKGTKKQNWEDRIFGTYEKLAKKNINFSEYVHVDDFWRCINGMYRKDYNKFQFKEKIIDEVCTFKNLEFYFTIPAMFMFPTGISIGACKSYEFNDLPKDTQEEFSGWWEIAYPWSKEEKEEKEYRLKRLKSFLFLKIKIRGIGFTKALEQAEDIVENNLNILRFIFKKPVNYTGITVFWRKRKISDGMWGDWENLKVHFSNPRAYDEMYRKNIDRISKLFSKKRLTELEGRVREAIIFHGISYSLPNNSLKLIVLCSGLESLVVKERGIKGERIAERIPDVLPLKNKTKIKGNLRKFYRKRSRVVHVRLKEIITNEDTTMCQDYLHSAIDEMLNFIDQHYEALTEKKGKKSLIKKFGWK